MIAILIPRAAPCRHRHFEIVPHSGPDVLVKLEFVVQRVEAGEPATCMPSGKVISKGAGTDCLGLIYVINIFEFLISPPALSDLPRFSVKRRKGEKFLGKSNSYVSTQNLLSERIWRFKSSRPHQPNQ
jgi:hypothetical protein